MDTDTEDLYRQLIDHNGWEHQLRILAEECGELSCAALGLARGRFDKLPNVCEEIADVEICIQQAKHILSILIAEGKGARTGEAPIGNAESYIQEIREQKLQRLNNMLTNPEVSESRW